MVKKFLRILGTEMNGLHETAYLLAFFTILSQVLGLVRDRLLAHIFGAGQALDIYYAAFRLPDLIFVSVASLVSISVLVPFLIEKLDKSHEEGEEFIRNIFSFFFFLIIAVTIIAFFLVPHITKYIFPGLA